MKNTASTLIAKLAPSLHQSIRSYCFFRYCKQQFGSFQSHFSELAFGEDEIRVMTGPFSNMRYFNKTVWGPITPKWIGSYEMELHHIIENIIEANYDRILDVGAADGYYAVGFSKSCPKAKIYSFDIDPIARRRQQQLASLNAIKNLAIGKYCSHQKLNELLNERSLLFCDIEGFEYELVDPDKSQSLLKADILLEVHSHGKLSATEVQAALMERFAESHDITEVSSKARCANEWKSKTARLGQIKDSVIQKALNEYRNDGHTWLWMQSVKHAQKKFSATV